MGNRTPVLDLTCFNRPCKESKLIVYWRNRVWRLNPNSVVLIYIEIQIPAVVLLFIGGRPVVKLS